MVVNGMDRGVTYRIQGPSLSHAHALSILLMWFRNCMKTF